MQLLECTCGKKPSFTYRLIAEDAVVSQFVCRRGNYVPGGGRYLGGCGKQGPEVEDAYSDRDTAASNWNAMIRKDPPHA